MKEVHHNLEHLTDFAIAYFTKLKEKYGKGRERQTELRIFDDIEATKVVLETPNCTLIEKVLLGPV
jgi:topoisomerase-4 subunit A